MEYHSSKGTYTYICESQKHYVEQKKLNPRIYTVWFHWYEALKQEKLGAMVKGKNSGCLECLGGNDWKRRELSGIMEMLYNFTMVMAKWGIYVSEN